MKIELYWDNRCWHVTIDGKRVPELSDLTWEDVIARINWHFAGNIPPSKD